MEKVNEIIGKNIKTLLAYNDKQQKDLADYLGVSKTSVSEWCKGTKAPRVNKVDSICEFLHCTRNDLFADKMFTFTEFKNRTAKRELMDIVENMGTEEVASVLAFIKMRRELNEG